LFTVCVDGTTVYYDDITLIPVGRRYPKKSRSIREWPIKNRLHSKLYDNNRFARARYNNRHCGDLWTGYTVTRVKRSTNYESLLRLPRRRSGWKVRWKSVTAAACLPLAVFGCRSPPPLPQRKCFSLARFVTFGFHPKSASHSSLISISHFLATRRPAKLYYYYYYNHHHSRRVSVCCTIYNIICATIIQLFSNVVGLRNSRPPRPGIVEFTHRYTAATSPVRSPSYIFHHNKQQYELFIIPYLCYSPTVCVRLLLRARVLANWTFGRAEKRSVKNIHTRWSAKRRKENGIRSISAWRIGNLATGSRKF